MLGIAMNMQAVHLAAFAKVRCHFTSGSYLEEMTTACPGQVYPVLGDSVTT